MMTPGGVGLSSPMSRNHFKRIIHPNCSSILIIKYDGQFFKRGRLTGNPIELPPLNAGFSGHMLDKK